ncbi:MAG: hypothetical protein H0V68_09880 [Actinobacteria bacterium]|nr:hypothetical protein [Actinomycetota bacterium]
MKTLAAVAAALAALVLPPPAAAHLVLEFDPQTARRGETVTVGFADAHDLAVDVYLVPLEAAREFEPPPSQAPVDLVPIGRLGAGGRLSFVVPDLPPGRYTTVLRRADGRYLASTQPQLPPGVDPAGFQEAPDPAIIRIRGEPRDTALLLAGLGLLFIGVLLTAAVVVRRRWRDAVSG